MAKLAQFFPDAESLAALQPEDLGMVLLKIGQGEKGRNFTFSDFQFQAKDLPRTGKQFDNEQLYRVLAEAWQWLINEGLLIIAPDTNGFFCLTRKAAALKTQTDYDTYRQGDLLPVGLLHDKIAEKVRPMFMRGDYDVAVFQAFKEVEVAVRRAGKYDAEQVGTKLMRKAFDPDNGPLKAPGVFSEREAVAHLYAGEIGHCKNPQSHREVQLNKTAAAQLIVLASYLLNDVEETEFWNSQKPPSVG